MKNSAGLWAHLVGAFVGLMASAVVAEFLAEDKCLDSGGRVAESGWSCELASGAVEPFLRQGELGFIALIMAVVGIPVYAVVAALSRRWIVAQVKHDG